jgi:hypothetical protein
MENLDCQKFDFQRFGENGPKYHALLMVRKLR